MNVENGDGAGKPKRLSRSREVQATAIARELVQAHAALQTALGGALQEIRQVRKHCHRLTYERDINVVHQLDTASLVTLKRFEAVGGAAAQLARHAVRVQELLDPPSDWREILRAAGK